MKSKNNLLLLCTTCMVLSGMELREPLSLIESDAKTVVGNVINPVFFPSTDAPIKNFKEARTNINNYLLSKKIPGEVRNAIAREFFNLHRSQILRLFSTIPYKTLKAAQNETFGDFLFDPIGEFLLATIQDHIKFWRVSDFSVRKDIIEGVFEFNFTPDGSTLIIIPGPDDLYHEDHEPNNIVLRKRNQNFDNPITLTGHTDPILNFVCNENGTLLASLDRNNTAKLWDLTTNQEIQSLSLGDIVLSNVLVKKDNVMLGLEGNNVHVIKIADNKLQHSIINLETAQNFATVHPTQPLLAIGSTDGKIHIWNLNTNAFVTTLTGHSATINYLEFSKNGSLLASSSDDKTIRLWNMQTKTSKVLQGHTGEVQGTTFSPDERTLVSTAFDQTIKLWDLTKDIPNEVASIPEHEEGTVGVDFYPGKLYFKGLHSGTLDLFVCDVAGKTKLRLWLLPNADTFTLDQLIWLRALAWAHNNLPEDMERQNYLQILHKEALFTGGIFANTEGSFKRYLGELLKEMKSRKQ